MTGYSGLLTLVSFAYSATKEDAYLEVIELIRVEVTLQQLPGFDTRGEY